MKIVAVAVTSLLAFPAFADRPGPGWNSQPGLERAIQKQGYQVTKGRPTTAIGKVK